MVTSLCSAPYTGVETTCKPEMVERQSSCPAGMEKIRPLQQIPPPRRTSWPCPTPQVSTPPSIHHNSNVSSPTSTKRNFPVANANANSRGPSLQRTGWRNGSSTASSTEDGGVVAYGTWSAGEAKAPKVTFGYFAANSKINGDVPWRRWMAACATWRHVHIYPINIRLRLSSTPCARELAFL